MNMFKKNGGFTLVELIVVIAILAILAAVAVPAYSGYINKANDAADTTALAAVKTAALAANATEGETVAINVTLNEGKISGVTAVVKTGETTHKAVTMFAKGASGAADTYDDDYKMFINGNSELELKGSFKGESALVWTAAKLTASITDGATIPATLVTVPQGKTIPAGWSNGKGE